MVHIDIFTVLVLTALNLGTVSLALPLIMGRGISKGARLAQISLMSQTLGWVFIIASDQWNGHWLDPVLSTASMASASLANYLMFFALQDWLGRRPGRQLLRLLTVAMPLGYALCFSNYALRVGYTNLVFAVQLLLVARAALDPIRPTNLPWRLLISVCYSCVAVMTAGRGILGGFFPELYPNFQSGHPVNIVAQITANVALVLTTVAVLVAWRDEAEAKLREQAYSDGLTGLLNRHGWDERAPALFDQSRRHATPLALIMLDLDHFKRVNDTLGHEVGDQVLRLFSGVLKENRRSSDLAARIGGEEFALLLPHTDLAAATLIEQRLRASLKAACAGKPRLTVDYSAGLAMLQATDTTLTAFMVRADKALYEAKNAGRGRLQHAG
jgi:diguanylate cyclase (GGDEF)-like protein